MIADMEALFFLIPLSVLIVFFAIWVFFKASDGGQFDDLVGPASRILQDDDSVQDKKNEKDNEKKTGQSHL